jgi:hypothetical protein
MQGDVVVAPDGREPMIGRAHGRTLTSYAHSRFAEGEKRPGPFHLTLSQRTRNGVAASIEKDAGKNQRW